jgi:predicted metalloendopeptidase
MVIGHEISQWAFWFLVLCLISRSGFDSKGKQFDGDGRLSNWWTAESSLQFEEKAKCFEEQYSSYEFEGMNVNGKLTINENIADNSGVKSITQFWPFLRL